MTVQKFLLAGLCLLMLGEALTAAEPEIRIFLVGDSIVQGYAPAKYPWGGWGQMLPYHFNGDVQVLNRAIGGYSSKSYIDEGHWEKALKDVKKDDYVFIEFGSNDQYPRLTEKYTDPDTTYQEFLKKYINDTRKAGATPVLVTMPIRMSKYKPGTGYQETHIQSTWNMPADTRKTSTTYHDAMRKVAKETETPLIDLNKLSKEKLIPLSFDEIKTYYNCCEPGMYPFYPNGNKDLEHTSVKGAAFMADCIASEIRRLHLPLENKLLENVKVNLDYANSVKLAPADISGRLNLISNDDKKWHSTDKGVTLNSNKAGDDATLNFTVAVVNKKNNGWPQVTYNLKDNAIKLNDYNYLRFLVKSKSNRKNPIGTILIVKMLGLDGGKCDYAFDAGKETGQWKEIIVPIKNIISMSGYPSPYWQSLKAIQFIISENMYNDGDKLEFSVKDIELLKTK